MSDTIEAPKSPEREAAELRKLELEINKLGIETNSLLIDQQLKQEELREKAAKADLARHDADYRQISLAEKRRAEELMKIQDHYMFHHFFDGPVNEKSVYGCLNTMNAWHRQHPDSAWEITINSPGGSVIDGMHLFDQLVTYSKRGGGNHEITITVRGYAASMGGILLQAADIRRIGRESYLMIHEISAGAGGKIGEIKDDVKWYEKVCERIVDIFVTRAAEAKANNPDKIKGITAATFKKSWERHDWWLDSDDALKHGFVDAIG